MVSLLQWSNSCFRLENIHKTLEEALHDPFTDSSLLVLRASNTQLYPMYGSEKAGVSLSVEEMRVSNFSEITP